MTATSLPKRTWFAVVVLAGCAYSNAEILGELEARARRAPDPVLDNVIAHDAVPTLQAPAQTATLPMVEGRVPAVRGRINGVDITLVLDTGTSAVVIPAEAARAAAIYLPPGDPTDKVGPGHTSPCRLGAFSTVELGPNRIVSGVALVPVDDRPGRWMELGTDRYAIVGCTVLSHFRVTFDFKKREVRLAPTGLPAYATPLLTHVRVNGRLLLLMVDSGATTVFLEPWAARDLDLISRDQMTRHDRRARSLSDAVFTRITLDRVEVGGHAFEDVDAAAVDTFGPLASSPPFRPGGLLGLTGFGDLVWTLDYGSQTLYVEP
ncbi:MAG TPA: pepsin/retropepsin-like aspartic protease family protein [Planctomycetota bacterium]|nr:pepsin/retropepsin-like aspartic protease family protein [Planctomycetota bacterium]